MNKEEILKKAQNRKPNQMDEMEMDIYQKQQYWNDSRFNYVCCSNDYKHIL